ncbi:MAG: TatD family hydrolase [Candidatus Diapherotrites archaeon]|nr:TatD family hydrolase [Candidatus Diapherotrites archaeon]
MLSDVHNHLYAVEDPGAVVRESEQRGVGLIITNAENVDTARKCLELAEKHEIVFAAVGIHPEYALRASESDLQTIEKMLGNEHVVAVGEIGLDYKFAETAEQRDRQKLFFRKQIQIAVDYDLPVEVHSRRAHKPVLDILSEYDVRANLHWFSGPMKDVLRGVDLGYFFSFGPAVLHYESYRAIVDVVPLEQTLLETDMPVRFGGEEARPWWVADVAKFIADVKKTSVDKVLHRTWQNARRLFRV